MQTAGAGSADGGAGGCRRNGEREPQKLVWARGRVGAEECPKSLVTPQSLEWVEKFLAWKFAGWARREELSGAGCGCVFDVGEGMAGWPSSESTK